MPKATLSMAPVRHNLKHCPEGWVDLRRMSFGELLASQDMAYQVSVKASEATGKDDPEVGMDMSQARVHEYQFKTCIVDHNLEDEQGHKLNFAQAATVHMLDPLIGQEISKQIDQMHRLDQKYPNSEKPSTSESSTSDERGMATTSVPAAKSPTSS